MSEANLQNYFLSKKTPYVKPLYSVDLKKDGDVLDWFKEMSNSLGEYFRPLFKEQRENLSLLSRFWHSAKFCYSLRSYFCHYVRYLCRTSASFHQ